MGILAPPMTDALTPAQALEYLRTLSADILDAAVLGADGSLLAGSARARRAGARRCSPPRRRPRTSRSRPPRAASSRRARTRTRSCSCAAASPSRRSCASTSGWCSGTSRASGAGRRVRRPRTPRPVGAVSASLARRRAGREPRVVVRTEHGELRTLAPEDPAARAPARGRRRADFGGAAPFRGLIHAPKNPQFAGFSGKTPFPRPEALLASRNSTTPRGMYALGVHLSRQRRSA